MVVLLKALVLQLALVLVVHILYIHALLSVPLGLLAFVPPSAFDVLMHVLMSPIVLLSCVLWAHVLSVLFL